MALQLTPENRPYQEETRAAFHARGLAYMVWERSDQELAERASESIRTYQPDAYLADVEGPMRDPTFPARIAEWHPNLPRALCATGAVDMSYPGTPPEVAAHWISTGFDLCMQDYIVHGPNMTPDRAENFAYWRGYPVQTNTGGHRHVPVLEVRAEGSPPLSEQAPLVKPWGGAVGIYLAEYLQDDDWACLASL